MNVVSMNDGLKAAHSLAGTILTLSGSDALSLDLAEAERDTETVISVFADRACCLSLEGGTYAAVVVIPPRRYLDQEVEEEGTDGPRLVTVPVAQPLNTEAVTLRLWALPEIINQEA